MIRASIITTLGEAMSCLKSVLVVMLSLVLVGCASSGNRTIARATSENVAANIEIGTTTKQDVRAAYGPPLGVSFTDSGNEIWRYAFARGRLNVFTGNVTAKAKELVVFFTKDGVVRNFSFTDPQVDHRSGPGS